ncbi:AraC family transcriptional regulator [uncultured Rhodoferax sp.]|uniref:AraC family transcriptional regulator n=1 Tax=uncultured Rhodoferax sp. TaxID=223188 RepID=UPI0025F02282|nr:AraC family transcriptional regulator [uncultured Rhodoferax sp.]
MNRSHSWTDYQERLSRVQAYIHDHLDQPLDLARLAEVAHLSPYHWHRVYHALYGETIAATVRRLRLHRATGYLAHTALPIEQVARKCGYPNVQSFTRAFSGLYGTSPSRYRAEGSHTVFRQGAAQPLAAGYGVELREVPQVRLAGVPHRGSYMRMGKAFAQAYTGMQAQGLMRPDTRWMSVYYDDPFAIPEAQLHSRAGLSLPPGHSGDLAAPLEPFTLGGGLCAVLHYRGPYASMRAAYQWLYGQWLIQSGHEAADLPVFEDYLNNPRDTAPADLLTDIYLPLLP